MKPTANILLKAFATLVAILLSFFHTARMYSMTTTIGQGKGYLFFLVIFPIMLLMSLIGIWRWPYQGKINQTSPDGRVLLRLAITFFLVLVVGVILPIHSVAILKEAPDKYSIDNSTVTTISRADYGNSTYFGFPFRYFWRSAVCDPEGSNIDTFSAEGSAYSPTTELGCSVMPNYVDWMSFLLNILIWFLSLYGIVWLVDWMWSRRKKWKG